MPPFRCLSCMFLSKRFLTSPFISSSLSVSVISPTSVSDLRILVNAFFEIRTLIDICPPLTHFLLVADFTLAIGAVLACQPTLFPDPISILLWIFVLLVVRIVKLVCVPFAATIRLATEVLYYGCCGDWMHNPPSCCVAKKEASLPRDR